MTPAQTVPSLAEGDRFIIQSIFEQDVIPKLRKMHARTGNLGCGFAGEAYACWTIRFRSVGSSFQIMAFEYDEEADNLDLEL